MSVINDVLAAVINMANAIKPYSQIVIGALPPDNGLSMTISAGAPDTTFMTKGMAYELDVVLNGKHTSQQTVSDTLNDIHQLLTQTKTYPATDEWQITNISTAGSPSYLDREQNKQWLYSSGLTIKFYYRKDD